MNVIITTIRVILGIYVGASLASYVYFFKHPEIKFTRNDVAKSLYATFLAMVLFVLTCLL